MRASVVRAVIRAITFSTILLSATSVAAQAPAGAAPTLIPLSGELRTADGQARVGTVVLVISLYEGQSDPAPRWIEYQTVTLDTRGRYTAQFGATRDEGLPADLFTSAPGMRWLGVAVEGEAEQPRVPLVSVPYAAKAASADALSGKTLSDFVLTSTLQQDVRAVLQDEGMATAAAISGGLNYVQKGDGAGGTVDSAVVETGGKVGIGTTVPMSALHLFDPSESELRLQVGGGTLGAVRAVNGMIDAGTFSNHPMRLITNSQERVRVSPEGYVGIGTPYPFSRLHILDNSESEFRLEMNNGALAIIRGVAGSADIGSFSNHPLRLFAGGAEYLRINPNGNIGIGTTNPDAKLHIAGDVIVDGNIGAKYQDVAEWVPAAEPVDAGSVVVIDLLRSNHVRAAGMAYSTSVIGAVSAQPGLILGEKGEGKVLVAQSGRVKVKADATFGAIRPGDLLVTSPTKGHVMRSQPIKAGNALVHRPGTLVGKALEGLPTGRGEILVLLTLQ